MKLDVYTSAGAISPGDMQGRVVAVIDVLRASTSIAVALGNGAKSVVPVEAVDEAIARSRQFERADVRLAGERKMQPIPGFDLGNSPLDFNAEAVSGRTVIITTTNGTKALMSLQGAVDIVVASYVNFSAVSAMLRAAARAEADISIVCAGTEGHFSLEDAACAGRYVRSIMKPSASVVANDAACACEIIDRKYGDNIAKIFKDSTHGKALAEAGFADDLVACAAVDSHPVVPIYHERQITRLGPERER
ncbi:MAG TPA: 2-phosphosulfolactate phosphatase [Gemmatimonadaceae bacterium]|nr:2-phosphosulfolactate phosphatase [Gemmatimonadaceae bacterium]